MNQTVLRTPALACDPCEYLKHSTGSKHAQTVLAESRAFQPMWPTRLWRKTIKSILKIRWHSTSTCKVSGQNTRQQQCIATLQHAIIGMQRATDSIQHSLRTAADRSSASKRTTVKLIAVQSQEQRPSPLVRLQHRTEARQRQAWSSRPGSAVPAGRRMSCRRSC